MSESNCSAGLSGVYEVYQYDFPAFGAFCFKVTSRGFCSAIASLTRRIFAIIDTVHGAEASAIIYSLVETAKANNLKIYEYLKYLLEKIPEHMDDANLEFIDDLLPWSESLPDCCRR